MERKLTKQLLYHAWWCGAS